MARYQVIFRGVARNNPGGVQSFLARFGQAYGMSADAAREFIHKARAVLYVCDDQASAQKSRAFLEGLGGVAEIKAVDDGPSIPAHTPPPPLTPSLSSPSVPPDFGDEGASSTAGAIAPSPSACPKCGCAMAEQEDECPSCHLLVSKYQQAMARRAAIQRAAPAPAVTMERPMATPTPDAPASVLPEARTALLLALGGLIVFLSFFLAPFAIYKGFQAMETLKRNPELRGKGLALAGVILGMSELVGLVFGVLMSRGII